MNYRAMLVTGGAGFIGANFVRHVLQHEPEVQIVNLDKLTYAGSLENLKNLPAPERHHFVKGDICDAGLVQKLLREYQIDCIVHFAAESHVDRSITGPAAFVQTNLIGTFTLLEAARNHGVRRFHHISTDEVYGSLTHEGAAFTEQTAYAPRSPYSASKAGSDHLVQAYYHTYGLPVTLSNCSNNYGPYQHPEKFIPTIIRSCLQNKPVPVYGNGLNIRDWLYVEDHCAAILQILKQAKVGENYNIGGGSEIENLQLAKYICARLDELKPAKVSYSSLLQFVIDRPGHDFRYAIDDRKIRSELGWQPKETFAAGMEKTLLFYLNWYHELVSDNSSRSISV